MNTKKQWLDLSKDAIEAMDKNALDFYEKYKDIILTLANAVENA